MGFVTAAALLIKIDEYYKLAADPFIDQEKFLNLESKLWYKPTAIPLSGVSLPGLSVRKYKSSCKFLFE